MTDPKKNHVAAKYAATIETMPICSFLQCRLHVLRKLPVQKSLLID
jgi:hypothetical protein